MPEKCSGKENRRLAFLLILLPQRAVRRWSSLPAVTRIISAEERGTHPGRLRRLRDGDVMPVTIKPTEFDLAVARGVAAKTNGSVELAARGLTWGGDEHVLVALAFVGWVATRGRSEWIQRAGNHALLVSVVSAAAPTD